MCSTVILFYVKVPVLSEHMHDTDPKVSTDSKFLTKTFFTDNLFAVIAKPIVIVPNIPSGTLDTNIPIA